ncbi:MAG: hypothetical protein M0C28_37005, partial [Candidatus Moduliflexus flocculans]|nr:hypothetical protein [Candidatus Moduliflexus flocculans]
CLTSFSYVLLRLNRRLQTESTAPPRPSWSWWPSSPSAAASRYYLAAAYALAFAAGAVAVERLDDGAGARRSGPPSPCSCVGVGASRSRRSGGPSCRWRRTCATPTALGLKPSVGGAPGARPPPAVLRRHARLARDGGGGGGRRPARCPRRTGRRPASSARTTGRPAAIEYFARDLDLPPAISGHNSYWLWGPGACTGEVMIVLGDRRERLEELFADVRLGAVSRCQDCMPYEDGLSIWVARGPKQPISRLWPRHQGLHLGRGGRLHSPRWSATERFQATPALCSPMVDGVAGACGSPRNCRTGRPEAAQEGRQAPRRVRPALDPWERYRALVDSLEEAQDLVELADRKARFALVIMGALNVAFFFLATRSEIVDYLPLWLRPFLGFYLLVYAGVALFFFLEAIEALRPRRFRPHVPYPGEGGPDHYPEGLRYYEDIVLRDLEAYRRAWREVRFGQLNAELAVQSHVMARINLDKFRSLRRLYGGLRVLTILAGGLLAMLALSMLFYHPEASLGARR